MPTSSDPASGGPVASYVTPEMDRHNRWIFSASQMLVYFAAPILYVGVVQAALCDRLGADAAVANLPTSAYSLGFLAPLFLSWIVPYRLERAALVIATSVTAVACAAVCATLFLPFPNSARIAAVVGHGLITGFSDSVTVVYRYQCLGRGTTVEGRARTLKIAFTIGPLSAVAGSLLAQLVLGGHIRWLRYPYDFGAIYLLAAICAFVIAALSSRFKLVCIAGERTPAFLSHLAAGVKAYLADRRLVILWFGCFLWYCGVNAIPTVSLYTRQVLGADPQQFSGLIMAIRFGGKALGGFVLGAIALRLGIRAPVIASALMTGVGIFWSALIPGYAFLLGFAMMGVGELGTPYFNNYLISVSPVQAGAKNLSLMSVSIALAGVAAVTYGALADTFGFEAAFFVGIVLALGSAYLVSKLPARPTQASASHSAAASTERSVEGV